MMVRQRFLLILGLLVSFFLDSYLSTAYATLIGGHLTLSSYLVVLMLAYCLLKEPPIWFYSFLVVFATFYDAHFFGTLGISVWIFPFFAYFFGKSWRLKSLTPIKLYGLVMLLVAIFSLLAYGFGRLYGLTNYPLKDLILWNTLPSLVLNTIYFVLLYPICKRLMQE